MTPDERRIISKGLYMSEDREKIQAVTNSLKQHIAEHGHVGTTAPIPPVTGLPDWAKALLSLGLPLLLQILQSYLGQSPGGTAQPPTPQSAPLGTKP